MSNETVRNVVEAYLQREDPGHALLIDAPWGAGKTHFIKDVIQNSASDAVYVTLYDIHSTDAFDWALVRATNTLSRGKFGKAFDMLTGAVGNMRAGDVNVNLGNLGKAAFTEYALRKLPNTLIFDDIERCGLEPKQISGLINRFVEHQKKRVILLANVEKIPRRSEAKQTQGKEQGFDVTREKLIGQTVTFKPDLDAALQAVWGGIADGQGKTKLQTHQHVIKETFDEAGHQNLRLILRAVRDCAVMLDALTPEMLKFEDAVERLIRTHLALHMAYHAGEIGKEDLNARNTIEPRVQQMGSSPIHVLKRRHTRADIQPFNASVFPVALCNALLIDGYANPQHIRDHLMGTNQFTAPEQRPDWVRLRTWDEENVEDLKDLLNRIDVSIEKQELLEPGEILQVYAALNWYGQHSNTVLTKENTRRFYGYIQSLSDQGLVRKRAPHGRDHDIYGFTLEDRKISYRDSAFVPDRRANLLAKKLRLSMDAAYDQDLPATGADLVEKLRKAPDDFLARFSDPPAGLNVSEEPILQACNVSDFASALLCLFEKDKAKAQQIAKMIGNRGAGRRKELAPEHPWIDKLKPELETQATVKDPLLAAQVRLFIARYMTPD